MLAFQDVGDRIGEIVETSSTGFTAQAYGVNGAAPLGSLVRTAGDGPVYAVVWEVSTSSLDPGRRPVALGRDEPDEEAVYKNNPQISRLFRTDFDATIIGYGEGPEIRQHLPPQPPKIHAFIHACTPEELTAFTQRLDFLPMLLSRPTPLADQVTSAFLRQAASVRGDADAFLATAGRSLARLLSRDYQRLTTLLRNLKP
jgi:hypothetical protein